MLPSLLELWLPWDLPRTIGFMVLNQGTPHPPAVSADFLIVTHGGAGVLLSSGG